MVSIQDDGYGERPFTASLLCRECGCRWDCAEEQLSGCATLCQGTFVGDTEPAGPFDRKLYTFPNKTFEFHDQTKNRTKVVAECPRCHEITKVTDLFAVVERRVIENNPVDYCTFSNSKSGVNILPLGRLYAYKFRFMSKHFLGFSPDDLDHFSEESQIIISHERFEHLLTLDVLNIDLTEYKTFVRYCSACTLL